MQFPDRIAKKNMKNGINSKRSSRIGGFTTRNYLKTWQKKKSTKTLKEASKKKIREISREERTMEHLKTPIEEERH